MKEQYIKINSDGKFYYSDKEMLIRHRIDGPAIEWSNGAKDWWVDGKLHRIDGPAVKYSDGSKSWWVDGKLHRMDGPAVEVSNGSKSWYVDDKYLTEAEFDELTRPKKDCTGQVVVVDGVTYKLVKA